MSELLEFVRPQITDVGNKGSFVAHKYGKCAMFGLQHLINCAKNDDPSTESLLQVGYELRYKYGCYLTQLPVKPIAPQVSSRAAGALATSG